MSLGEVAVAVALVVDGLSVRYAACVIGKPETTLTVRRASARDDRFLKQQWLNDLT